MSRRILENLMNPNYRENAVIEPIDRNLFTQRRDAKIKAFVFALICFAAIVVMVLDIKVWRP